MENEQIAEFELVGVLENSTEVTFRFNVSREVSEEDLDSLEGADAGRVVQLRSRASESAAGADGAVVGGDAVDGAVGADKKSKSSSSSWLSSLFVGDAPEVKVDGVPKSGDDDSEMVIGDDMSEEGSF